MEEKHLENLSDNEEELFRVMIKKIYLQETISELEKKADIEKQILQIVKFYLEESIKKTGKNVR